MRSIPSAVCAGVAAMALTMPAAVGAQGPRNQDTYFTFSQAVELPNTTLPAGTYLFKLLDSPSNRHVVRVFSEDQQKLFATVLAIPAYTLDRPAAEPEIRFMEAPASAPNAIKTWFYPGRTVGHEFIYPRSRARELAKATGDDVLTTKTERDVSKDVADDDLSRMDPQGRDVEASREGQRPSDTARRERGRMAAPQQTAGAAGSSAPQTSGQGTPATPATQTPPAQTQANPAPAASAPAPQSTAPAPASPQARQAPAAETSEQRTTLPQTAGMLPWLLVVGIGAVAASRVVRRARRQ